MGCRNLKPSKFHKKNVRFNSQGHTLCFFQRSIINIHGDDKEKYIKRIKILMKMKIIIETVHTHTVIQSVRQSNKQTDSSSVIQSTSKLV